MKVGVQYDMRNAADPRWFTPWPEYYCQTLDHIAEIDRLGFNSVNFCEHHFDPDGYNPSILLTMTAVALRTQNMMIGQNILQMPYHHPVRLAEDLATIDIISGGRVTLNVGGGAFDDEALAFGMNPGERYSRTTESIEIVRRCWTADVFSYEGKRFKLQDVRVYPKPLQQPHPAIWVTAMNEHSMERAARLGINACAQGGYGDVALGDKAVWDSWNGRWQTTLAKYGRKPGELKTNVFGVCFVTDDPEREWAKHREAIFYGRSYRRHNGRQPYLGWFQDRRAEKPEDLRGWQTYFRTPEDCVRHLRETFSESAPDELLVYAERPGIPLADTAEYMRLFAEKVLPYVQDLPVTR